MATVVIKPSIISGILKAPPSKSCMQRACAAALLSGRCNTIINYGISNDDIVAIELIKKLGAIVVYKNDKLHIDATNFNKLQQKQQQIVKLFCGESGLSLRMFTPIAALLYQEIMIEGKGSLVNRPIDFFGTVLPQLNVDIETNFSKLPIKIKGPLQASCIEIDGSLSSQFLTGLLFAFSYKNEDVVIKVNDLKSKPYTDLTLEIMKEFGLNVPINNNYNEFVFCSQSATSIAGDIEYAVEGDWSNTAFLLVAAAIAGSILVEGLHIESTQADRAILNVLKDVGCNLTMEKTSVAISQSKKILSCFVFDATNCPDLFPPLVALASCCNGTSIIKGVSRLKHKESDRALSLKSEFEKMGVRIEIQNDEMLVEGTKELKTAIINSHNDHRIAMACAVAALNANGNVTIENAEAINKSYPNFYKNLKTVGASIHEIN